MGGGGSGSLRDPDNISEDNDEDLDDWEGDVDRALSPRDGNTDCEGSSPSLSDDETAGGGGRSDDDGGHGDGNGKSVNAASRKIDATRVRGRNSHLRWGIAYLLDARLGGYMLPGAAGPDVSCISFMLRFGIRCLLFCVLMCLVRHHERDELPINTTY